MRVIGITPFNNDLKEEKSMKFLQKLGQGVIRHFAFAVKDVEACVAAVRAGGYPILVEPKTVAIGGNAAFSAKIAFCKGALGEKIEFFQQMWQ